MTELAAQHCRPSIGSVIKTSFAVIVIFFAALPANAEEGNACYQAQLDFDKISPTLFQEEDVVALYGGSEMPTCAQAGKYEKWFLQKEEAAKKAFRLCGSIVISDFDYTAREHKLKTINEATEFYATWYRMFLYDKKRVCSENKGTVYSERQHECARLAMYFADKKSGYIENKPINKSELPDLIRACNGLNEAGCQMYRSNIRRYGEVPHGLTCRATPAELEPPPK